MASGLAVYGFPLFVSGPATSPADNSLSLFTQGAGGSGDPAISGAFSSIPLVLTGLNEVSGVMPLFLAGSARGSGEGIFPLSVVGGIRPACHSLPLFVSNTTSGAINTAPLYVCGAGSGAAAGIPGLLGGESFGASMSLTVKYGPSATLSLYIGAPGMGSGFIPLTIWGAGQGSGSLPLVMPYTKGSGVNSLPLSTTGF